MLSIFFCPFMDHMAADRRKNNKSKSSYADHLFMSSLSHRTESVLEKLQIKRKHNKLNQIKQFVFSSHP